MGRVSTSGFGVISTLSAMGLAPLACGSGPSARLPEANNLGYRNLRKEIGDKYAKFRSYKIEDCCDNARSVKYSTRGRQMRRPLFEQPGGTIPQIGFCVVCPTDQTDRL